MNPSEKAIESSSRMVMPRQVRENAYRGGIIQIRVTRLCDKSCVNCTQGSNLKSPPKSEHSSPPFMLPDQFEEAVASLEGYFGVVGVFGGNPAMSPYFEDYCRIMRERVPFHRRGLWCNRLMGKGAAARETFCPAVCNLNVHMDQNAYDEFRSDWPESMPFGLEQDSRHSPPWVSISDVIESEPERWSLIESCDINRNWSAIIGLHRGRLRAWFCEIAGAQAMLHETDDGWPDTGVAVSPGWWTLGHEAFAHQVEFHCMRCGVPLRGHGDLAVTGINEYVSPIHLELYRPKSPRSLVNVVRNRSGLNGSVGVVTSYLENGQ